MADYKLFMHYFVSIYLLLYLYFTSTYPLWYFYTFVSGRGIVSMKEKKCSHVGNMAFPRWERNIPTLGINAEP